MCHDHQDNKRGTSQVMGGGEGVLPELYRGRGGGGSTLVYSDIDTFY